MSFGDELSGAIACHLAEVVRADERHQVVQAGQERQVRAADGNAFRGQRVAADLPAAVDLAHHQFVRHEHVVDEDLVE